MSLRHLNSADYQSALGRATAGCEAFANLQLRSTGNTMRAKFDKRLACAINTNSSSLSWLAFLRAHEGEPKSSARSEDGAKSDANRRSGQSQNPARQLTSPANLEG